MPSPSWSKELERHRELLRPVEPSRTPSRWQQVVKRILTVCIALVLLLLLLVYLVPGYDLLSILEGRIVSTQITDLTIILQDGRKIIFQKEVYEALQKIYVDNQKTEFSVCLQGEKQENTYKITGLSVPRTYEQDVFHVRAELCSKETLIALHSHPYKKCIFSEADIRYYNSFANINKDGLIGLMCEPTRFAFYP